MAQSGYTPILIYASGTTGNTPSASNLTSSSSGAELALNYFDGKLYYKDASGNVQVLATKGAAQNSISFGTTGLTPSTATQGAVTVAGTLITSNGGTGLSSWTAGDLPYYASGTALSKLGIGTNGYILTSNGTAPVWTAGSSISVNTATNLAGGAAGSVPYQSGAGATTFLSIGTANTVMTSSGTAPQWSSSLTLGGNLVVNGNTTLGDAAADTVTVNGTITSNLIFTDNTYDIGASGATRPRNLYLSGAINVGSLANAPRYVVSSTSNAGTSDISLGSYSSGAWLNSPSGTTGYLATAGNGILSWTGSTIDVPVGTLTVSGTGSRGVRLRGGGNGAVDIAGDGTTYALGLNFYNSTSYSTVLSGIYAYGASGAYQYMSLGGTSYNNGAIYIDSNKKVGILKLPAAQFDSLNTVSMQNAQSTGLGYGAAITQGTGTLAMAAGTGNQRGNLMTIYGAQGSPTTTIPYGADYNSLGLTVAMDVAAGGGYNVTGIGSYVRTDGSGSAFRANIVQTNGSVGTYTYGFYAESSSGANVNYGFYQAGSSTYNYFNGWVGVGVNNVPYGNTTYERMTIEGSYNGRQWISNRNTSSGSSAIVGYVLNAYGNSWALEMGSAANNSNALNITKDIYGAQTVMAYMQTNGIMTFYGDNSNRPVKIGGGYVEIKGESGGWEIGYLTSDSAATRKGSFGAAGTGTSLSFMYIAAGGGDSSSSAARFTSNGIGLGTTTPATSGVGITFPATQSSSSGANTLDDYERGSWTPSVASTGGATFTYGANTGGTYIKIGRWMYLMGVMNVATKSGGSSGDSLAIILPIAAGASDISGSGVGYHISAATCNNLTVPSGYSGFPQGGVCTPNQATFYPFWTDGANNRIMQLGDIANGFQIQFSIAVFTNT